MSSSCRPWFKWYPKDFMADEKVRALSPMGELIYRRILDVLWETSECQLPNDIQFIHRATCKDISFEEFKDVWNEIQYPEFEILKSNEKYVWSKRLKQQLAECIERSEVAREKAYIRWDKEKDKMQQQCNGINPAIQKQCDKDKDKDKEYKYKRAVKIPKEFNLQKNMIDYFKKQGCEDISHIDYIFNSFVNYWGSNGGKKQDWTKTFYNWVLNDKKKYHPDKYIVKNYE